MNYTKNYQLPQWVESDRVLMTDFNQMCADIDAGLTANKAAADAGIAKAQAAAEELPYAVGSYTGNGKSVTIELGFRPSAVLLYGISIGGSVSVFVLFSAGNTCPNHIVFTDTGFKAVEYTTTAPHASYSGVTYDYIAFR